MESNTCEHRITIENKCNKCFKVFDSNEIIDVAEKNLYWGVSSKELILEFIKSARLNGFFNAIQEEKFKTFNKYAIHDKRADFHFLLPLQKDASILDVGSGYGNVTIPMATWYGSVTAVDATRELLEFSKLRADESGVKNITYVHTDPFGTKELPFENNSFDGIVVNGVLEWVGNVESHLNPRDLQQSFLKDLRRIVKKDGFLYVGIENRWYPLYFYNIPDPHSKVMYTGVVWRWLANIIMRKKGSKIGYRNYIYGLRGYKKLLKESGWYLKKVYVPWPSYREVDVIFDVNSKKAKNYFFKDIIYNIMPRSVAVMYKLLSYFNLEKFFYHSYILVAVPEADCVLKNSQIENLFIQRNNGKKVDMIKLKTEKESDRCLIRCFNDPEKDVTLSILRSRLNDCKDDIIEV